MKLYEEMKPIEKKMLNNEDSIVLYGCKQELTKVIESYVRDIPLSDKFGIEYTFTAGEHIFTVDNGVTVAPAFELTFEGYNPFSDNNPVDFGQMREVASGIKKLLDVGGQYVFHMALHGFDPLVSNTVGEDGLQFSHYLTEMPLVDLQSNIDKLANAYQAFSPK